MSTNTLRYPTLKREKIILDCGFKNMHIAEERSREAVALNVWKITLETGESKTFVSKSKLGKRVSSAPS